MLKNLIDWTSRLRPQPFNGKQGFLLSASPSMAGGNRGLWSLRIPLEHLDFVVDLRNRRLIGNPAHGGEHVYEMY